MVNRFKVYYKRFEVLPPKTPSSSKAIIMPSNDDLLRIITDDERFLRTVFSFKNCQELQIREIPYNSFTRFRLTYASPVDISTASKTRLLGGVPAYWHQEKKNKFWQVFIKLYTRKLRKSIKSLTSHGYRRVYIGHDTEKGRITNNTSRDINGVILNLPNSNSSKLNESNDSNDSNYPKDSDIVPLTAASKCSLFRRHSTGSMGIHNLERGSAFDYLKKVDPDKIISTYVYSMVRSGKVQTFKRDETTNTTTVKSSKSTVKYSKRNKKRRKRTKPTTRPIQQHNKNLKLLKLLDPVAVIDLPDLIKDTVLLSDTDDTAIRHSNFLSIRQHTKNIIHTNKVNKNYHSFQNHDNVILCDDVLIMEKIGLTKEGPNNRFNEDENIDTRIEEQWTECVSILYKTGDLINPLLIKCYKKNKRINANTIINVEKAVEPFIVIPLNKLSVFNFYSTLDKTVSIQTERLIDKHHREIYLVNHVRIHIMQFKLSNTSFKWLNFLKSFFSKQFLPKQFALNIPEVNLSLSINLSSKVLEQLEKIEDEERNVTKIAFLHRGIHVLQSPLLRYLHAIILKTLKSKEYKQQFLSLYNVNSIAGCGMKSYDLIDWQPKNDVGFLRKYNLLRDSHSLEFRRVLNYPFSLEIDEKQWIREPTPVEGFLLQVKYMNATKVNYLKSPSYSPYYFFSTENLLFYTSSFKSSPPLPIDINIDEEGAVNNYEVEMKKFNKIPEIFEQDPYEMTSNGTFKWLTPECSDEEFKKNDHFAFKCYNRKVAQILKAEGVLDISSLYEITLGKSTELNNDILDSFRYAHYSFWKKFISLEELKECLIVIKIKNHSSVHLLAPTCNIAAAWVEMLNKMKEYWKQRHYLDIERLKKLQLQNMAKLTVNPMGERTSCDKSQKWTLDGGVADEILFNINEVSLLRPIIQKDILFQKIRKHSSFSKYFVILIPGFMMLFSHDKSFFNNSSFGGYVYYETIPIEDCYVYSGTSCAASLTSEPATFNILNPGCQAVPKLYEDECITIEENINRTFTLYFGKKTTLEEFSLAEKLTKQGNSSGMFTETFSNQFVKSWKPCKSMTFMTKSRYQRDLWVLSLQKELERLNTRN